MSVPLPHRVFSIDETRWPVVVVRIPPDSPDEVVFEMVRRMGEVPARGRCAFVYDIPSFVLPNAYQRRAVVDGLNDSRRRHPGRVAANAIVTSSSAMMEGMVRAITWLRPSTEPTRMFRSIDDAVAWAEAQLALGEQRASL